MRQRPAYIILIIIYSTSISMSRLHSTAFGGLVLIWWSMCYIYISKYYLSSFPIWNKQALLQLLFLQYYISCHLSEPSYNSAVSDAHLPCLHNWLPAVNFPPVVIDRLKKEYPDAGCTLDYDQAWKLLVSVRLAAQCTDARVNVVVEWQLIWTVPNRRM